jgi:hypothetical protein
VAANKPNRDAAKGGGCGYTQNLSAGSAETKEGILRRQAGRPVVRRTYRSCSSILRILLFHIADDGLSTIVHMDMLDANNLLTAMTQAS